MLISSFIKLTLAYPEQNIWLIEINYLIRLIEYSLRYMQFIITSHMKLNIEFYFL